MTVLEDNWPLDATDSTPMINKIFAAYKDVQPDVLFVMSSIVQTPHIHQRSEGPGRRPCPSSRVPSRLTRPSSSRVTKWWKVCSYRRGHNQSLAPARRLSQQSRDARLRRRYEARYDEVLTLFAGAAYDSFHILLEGLKAGGDDKAKVRDAIEALQDFPVLPGRGQLHPRRSPAPRRLRRVAGQDRRVHVRADPQLADRQQLHGEAGARPRGRAPGPFLEERWIDHDVRSRQVHLQSADDRREPPSGGEGAPVWPWERRRRMGPAGQERPHDLVADIRAVRDDLGELTPTTSTSSSCSWAATSPT